MQESSTAASSVVTIDIRRLPWVRALLADYVYRFDAVAAFYAGDPARPEAWREAVSRARAHSRPRQALAHVLEAQLDRRDAPPAAREAAARLALPETVAVVTGQQAGVLGGPLFTLLKALTAIRLARRLEREYGVPAVAVFWIDAEDHDWDEVAGTVVLDADYELRSLRLPSPPRANEIPVASVTLDAGVTRLLEELRASLAPTEFTDELLASLGSAYRPGLGMADAFGRWLERLLGPRGLVVYDCADPAAKPLAAPVFVRELSELGRTWQLASAAGAALEARGYHAQVTSHTDGVALFYLDGGRHAIHRDGDRLTINGRPQSADALRREAEVHPERFSPNVLLRPLVQDTLFPTVAYVGGPSELAYLGQLRQVYAHFGVPMPLVVPRATATLLDSAGARFLARYNVPLAALQPQDEAELNRLLEAQLPPVVEEALQDAARTIEAKMAAVIAAVPDLDPTLEGAARSTLGRMTHDLRALHQKVIHAAKRRHDTLRRQFVRTRTLVFPYGHPQERTLGFVWFLNRYGPALIDILERELPTEAGVHVVLTP